MVHRFLKLLLTALLAAALLPACRSKKTGDNTREPGNVPAEMQDPAAPGIVSADNKAAQGPEGLKPFGSGVINIFGIKIPTGMTPARGPEKVYRFEGKLPPQRVAGLIRDQIYAEKELPEGDGVLFRSAKVRRSTFQSAGNKGLAVRIAPTLDGSILDIWLEREHPNALPGTAAAADFPRPKQQRAVRKVETDKTRAEETRRRAVLMRSLEKIQKGEPLTPEEAASGVYD